jgi:hypothetical protein
MLIPIAGEASPEMQKRIDILNKNWISNVCLSSKKSV